MTAQEREKMNALCIRIQEEKNYETFIVLSRELGDLIERKDARLGNRDPRDWRRNRPWKTVPAVVKKVLQSFDAGQPEKVEIELTAAEDLFREVRIENTFTGISGQPVALKAGTHVDVTFEATEDRTGTTNVGS